MVHNVNCIWFKIGISNAVEVFIRIPINNNLNIYIYILNALYLSLSVLSTFGVVSGLGKNKTILSLSLML